MYVKKEYNVDKRKEIEDNPTWVTKDVMDLANRSNVNSAYAWHPPEHFKGEKRGEPPKYKPIPPAFEYEGRTWSCTGLSSGPVWLGEDGKHYSTDETFLSPVIPMEDYEGDYVTGAGIRKYEFGGEVSFYAGMACITPDGNLWVVLDELLVLAHNTECNIPKYSEPEKKERKKKQIVKPAPIDNGQLSMF